MSRNPQRKPPQNSRSQQVEMDLGVDLDDEFAELELEPEDTEPHAHSTDFSGSRSGKAKSSRTSSRRSTKATANAKQTTSSRRSTEQKTKLRSQSRVKTAKQKADKQKNNQSEKSSWLSKLAHMRIDINFGDSDSGDGNSDDVGKRASKKSDKADKRTDDKKANTSSIINKTKKLAIPKKLSAREKRKQKDTYTSVKNRPTRIIFNQTSGASARADFSADKSRYHLIWVFAGILFLVLMGRAFQLQVVNAQIYQEKGNKFITSVRTLPTYRGMITDRNNLPLAVSAPLATVSFNPYEYARTYYQLKKKIAQNSDNPKREAKLKQRLKEMDLNRLATAANIDVQRLIEVANIRENINLDDKQAIEAVLPSGAGSKYFPLLTKVPPEVADVVMALDFTGVYQEDFYQRYYPQSYSSSQLVGFMGQNANDPEGGYQGRAGLEHQYQKQLSGKDGKVLVLRDARRASLKDIKQIEPEVAGKDVQLTIDSRLQFLLYQELEKVGRKQRAFWSSGIVVDVHTGEVLALSTWPSYNANKLSEMTGESQRNRPLLDVFEPGSVVKPFTVAAALESGKFSKRSYINTSPGYIKVKGYTIRDHDDLGSINFTTLLQHSSNVGSTKIALSLPPTAISDLQRKFGFGSKTGLHFPGEQAGSVTTPKKSQTARRATVSYGYGLQVTLAQIAQAYAALGSGGVMHPLSLIKGNQSAEGEQIISKDHALSIVEMMESVTMAEGTAPAAAIDGYRVAGKTGTTRRVNPKGGYFKDKYRTVFAGIAPVSNPRLAVVILVENPKKNKYAGQVAAPVFHNVMKEALRLYNVPLDKPLIIKKEEADKEGKVQ